MRVSQNLNLCSFFKVPSWILPVVPAQPDPVHLLSSPFGLLDAQPPKPVCRPTNCLPVENTDLSIQELISSPRLLNPPATSDTMSIWTKLSEECFQCLGESMPRRIKEALKAKVDPSRY
ncbi:hypothetical protein ATANTOWER_028472 [Ataeniobius toweri]|uniref:Uncharacterized protein n=1 Tax=Ataeniobius toweri TaxID=208326 RepID=A0ABU7BAN2_9TELE|nr:hypothetical protein [Ataeniobius toweri]